MFNLHGRIDSHSNILLSVAFYLRTKFILLDTIDLLIFVQDYKPYSPGHLTPSYSDSLHNPGDPTHQKKSSLLYYFYLSDLQRFVLDYLS